MNKYDIERFIKLYEIIELKIHAIRYSAFKDYKFNYLQLLRPVNIA